MAFEWTDELFLQHAQSFVRYYSELADKQGFDEWITGREIAKEWVEMLTADTISIDSLDALIVRADVLKSEGGTGALDLYMHLNGWKGWIAEHPKKG